MKFAFGLVALACIAMASADVSHLAGITREYLPPHQHQHHQQNGRNSHHESHGLGRSLEANSVNREYLPPNAEDDAPPAHKLEADGYHYKTPESNRLRF